MKTRRKRETAVNEVLEKPSVDGKGKHRTDGEAKVVVSRVSENTPDHGKSQKPVGRQRKRKNTEVVSEYFDNGSNRKEPAEKPSTMKKSKSELRKENTVKAEVECIMESDEENEFEESGVIYRSPTSRKTSQKHTIAKARKNDRKKNKKESSTDKNNKEVPAQKRKNKDRDECIHPEKVKKAKHADSIEEEKDKNKENENNDIRIGDKANTASHNEDQGISNNNNDSLSSDGVKRRHKKNIEGTSSTSHTSSKAKKPDIKPENKSANKRKTTKDMPDTSVNRAQNSKGSTGVKHLAIHDKKPALPKVIDHSDVTAVLLHMEGAAKLSHISVPSTSKAGTDKDADVMSDSDDSDADSVDGDKENASEDSEEDDWEEVEDHHGHSPKKSQLPDKPVEFTLDAPLVNRKRQKKQFDWKAYFRRKMNRFKKEIAMEMHKVHLLCLTARCLYLHNIYQDEVLRAQALSVVMVTGELTVSPKKCTVDQLGKMVAWIQQTYTVDKTGGAGDDKKNDTLSAKLRRCLQDRCLYSHLELVSVCVLLLRQVGFKTRLTMSLQPLSFKETSSKTTGKGNSSSKKLKNTKGKKSAKGETGSSKSVTEHKSSDTSKQSSKNKSEKLTKAKKESNKKGKLLKNDNGNSKSSKGKKRTGRRCSKDLPKDVYLDGDDEVDSEEEYSPNADSDTEEEEENKNRKNKKGKSKTNINPEESENSSNESDSDFEENSILFRTQALKRTSPASKNRKVLSSESDSSLETSKGADEWVEVYLEKEHRWICIDCVTGRLDKPYDIEHNATQPVTYVIGVNNDGHIKDVTQRYASQWLTSTRKLRVDAEWWEETLEPYRSPNNKLDKLEDQEIQAHLQKRPLPTSIGDFKSHPLYALQRHLLKFEAIYPPSAVPLGYIRGEPVFARECVYTLHSRENWLKEGRAVRLGEEAYKFVKSRPKWNKPKENPDAKDLEIFGIWQTEVYIPPPAVDGKVPRNAHGNVEMFLPSMLPGGTAHLKLPGLNKIAKKLDIDCAPAMVGWDHHCGFSHPMMDGWIVCEEFKDILLAAWDEEQEIIKEREAAKREKRVYDNWRKLIRGLLIRERLKKRFDLESGKKTAEPSTCKKEKQNSSDSVKTESGTVSEKATDVQLAWPQNRLKTEVTTYKMEEL